MMYLGFDVAPVLHAHAAEVGKRRDQVDEAVWPLLAL